MEPLAPPVAERVLLLIAYDGAPYSGFAQQTNAFVHAPCALT